MKKSFWFHYNKPESRKVGRPQITVHFDKACHVVDNISSVVPLKGRIRKSQPYWVMAGKANNIHIENGVATIN